MESINELFDKVLSNRTDEIYVQNPCKVVGINGNFVDVLLYINDDEPDMVIYNVPIMRPETQRAYIFLGIKEGDRGICRFFDRSTEGYLQSDFDYNSDDRQHDINDRTFELGFIPNEESFVYPTDKEIEIGLKNAKFKLSIDNDGNVNIISEKDVTINITGDVTSTVKGNQESTIEGNFKANITGDATTNITGNAYVTAPTINTTGVLNQVGAVNITGAVNINGALIASGEVTGNNILLSQHVHIGNLGQPTSTPQ